MKSLRPLKVFVFSLAVIVILSSGSVSYGACGQDSIARVERGMILMASGAVYRIIDNNGVALAFWLPPSGVVICEQLTPDNQLYFSISNQDQNETVFAIRER